VQFPFSWLLWLVPLYTYHTHLDSHLPYLPSFYSSCYHTLASSGSTHRLPSPYHYCHTYIAFGLPFPTQLFGHLCSLHYLTITHTYLWFLFLIPHLHSLHIYTYIPHIYTHIFPTFCMVSWLDSYTLLPLPLPFSDTHYSFVHTFGCYPYTLYFSPIPLVYIHMDGSCPHCTCHLHITVRYGSARICPLYPATCLIYLQLQPG